MSEDDRFANAVARWLSIRTDPTVTESLYDKKICIGSTVGLVRNKNEDRVCIFKFVSHRNRYLAGVVCDGLGGMLNGDEAAALAVATFVSAIVRYTPKFTGRDSLVMAVNDANLAVYEKLRGDGGTTLAAALFSDDGGMWGINVGDSRIYRYNPKSELIQLSIDDTVAGRAEHSRAASFEILRSTEFGARLTQFIGMGRELNSSIVDLSQVSGNGGILLATDGIWKAGHDGFSKIVLQAPNADSIGKRLLRYSNWCGGIDNASVIVVSNPTDIMRKNPVENREYGEANSYVDVWNAYGKLTLFPEVILEKSLSKKDGTVRKSRKRTKLNLPIK